MNSENNQVALIIHTCDRYAFLYNGFEYFFTKYWDHNIKCNYYFATEELQVNVKGFENILSGKGEWSDRLAYLLREKIREKYVLYFQEDMWLNKKVNADFFNTLFITAEKKFWLQVKLHSSAVYKTVPTGNITEGFSIAKLDNERSDFLMSHQVTLWEKDFLLHQLPKKEHPWRNERKGTKRLKKLNPDIFQIDYFAENGADEINNNSNPVLRSEYLTVSINGTLHGNVQHYIPELMTGNTQDQEYALQLEHHYKNNLTHDGLEKPRKIDIFKKIKTCLKK